MNGADASAAAGLNSTKENWHYTGPALPAAESQLLLADGGNDPDQIHMARSGCAKEPTSPNRSGPPSTSRPRARAVARYTTPAAAQAAGYEPVSPPTTRSSTTSTRDRGAESSRGAHPRTRGRRRPCLCDDAFGGAGSRRRHVLAPRHAHDGSADALRLARPVARAHRSLRPETGSPAVAVDDHGLRTVSGRFNRPGRRRI